jgi:hypothetical protein
MKFTDRLIDINYPRGMTVGPVCVGDYGLVSSAVLGDPDAEIERRQDESGKAYRYLRPSTLSEVYRRADGTRFVINRRRGFGQYGLVSEFADRSIGVFMHRGDSPGESGSNVYFLANKATRHPPCGRLFDKLSRKLADRSLVITDGSNTSIRRLKKFHNKTTDGRTAYGSVGRFSFGGFDWECVGYLSYKYGPTLVWGLTRTN